MFIFPNIFVIFIFLCLVNSSFKMTLDIFDKSPMNFCALLALLIFLQKVFLNDSEAMP